MGDPIFSVIARSLDPGRFLTILHALDIARSKSFSRRENRLKTAAVPIISTIRSLDANLDRAKSITTDIGGLCAPFGLSLRVPKMIESNRTRTTSSRSSEPMIRCLESRESPKRRPVSPKNGFSYALLSDSTRAIRGANRRSTAGRSVSGMSRRGLNK